MMEDELIKIWQSSPEAELIKFEKSRLMIELDSSLKRIQRGWKYMLIREFLAAVIGIPIFTYIAFTHPFTLTRIGSVLTVLSIIYIIFRLLRIDRQKPNNYSETYLDFLLKSREVLGIQKKSLDNVLYWYVLPLYPGLILIMLGFIHIPEKINIIYFTFSLTIVGSIVIHFLNKRAVKKQFIPRLQKIDDLINTLKE